MPQPPTPNMSLVAPTPGSDPNTWGTILNTLIDILDAHTHAAGSGVKIPASAIQWDADITAAFSGVAFALLGARAVDFTPEPSADVAALSSAIFVDSADNNLKFRNSSGVNVQITSGPTLAISASGGIGGDYTTAGAEVAFDNGNDLYTFKQQVGAAVRQFARVQVGGLDLFEFKAHPAAAPPTNRVRLSSPAALAASYELTMPGALPAVSTALMQVSSAGVVSFRSSPQRMNWGGCAAALPSASAPTYTVDPATGEAIWTFAAGQRLAIPCAGLREGDRIENLHIRANSTPGTGSLTLRLWRKTSTVAPTQIGTDLIHANTTTDQAGGIVSAETVDAGDEFHIIVSCTAGAPILYSVGATVGLAP